MTKLVDAIPQGRTGRRLGVALSLSLALALAGCGETNPLNPTPQPTPTPSATKADVRLTLSNAKIEEANLPGYIWAIVTDLHLTENAGVSATIDFLRLDVFLPNNTMIERTQISGGQIPGGTALSSRGVRDFTALTLGFNSDLAPGRYVIVSVGTTDARGNAQVTNSGPLIF